MASLYEIKERQVTDTPIILFDCELVSGLVERWSTHRLALDGHQYQGRVLRHNLFELKAAADGGVDAATRLSITLANADAYMSQVARTAGLKGAKLTARFAFVDLSSKVLTCEPITVFQGLANPPDEITDSYLRVTFANRMSGQRVLLPEVRIQRRCPWLFPQNETQRSQALDGGSKREYSPFYRCGYSAGLPGGAGNLDNGAPYTSCDYTRDSCVDRGMFDEDSNGHSTRRFGGVQFVPSSILVKSYGESGSHLSTGADNEAKYNDFVPLVYGTAWQRPPVIFARNDGNLTHMEVLLGMGEIEKIIKVVVNGYELPAGSSAQSPTSTGWFNIVSVGRREGEFNLDFKSSSGTPAGDPYGSMAVCSVVVPNRIADGSNLPRIEVLMEGLKLPTFGSDGEFSGTIFSNNPAWVLLDLLRRSGWTLEEVDLSSFSRTAEYCSELIETTDTHGNTRQIPRFQCNLVVRRRRSAADLIRGVRNNAALTLGYGSNGLLQLKPESALAIQQPTKPESSNSRETLNGGWPAYEFGDGTEGFSNILRKENGEPSLRLWSRATAESPNRYSIEFQDEFNEYQQDSLSLVDIDDSLATGQEITSALTALGIPNYNQAGRLIRLFLDRSIRGNLYVQFETGVRGIGIIPGDLITVTYRKEGMTRQPFRVISVSPSLNYSSSAIVAQVHDDSWYAGGSGSTSLIGGGRQPAFEIGAPRPLLGTKLNDDGSTDFEIAETALGDDVVSLSVSYTAPAKPSQAAPSAALLSLTPEILTTGGSLSGGQSYYYAVSSVSDGNESALSFTVRADLPASSDSNVVKLNGLSFAPGATEFHVYRGPIPSQLFRIATSVPAASTFSDSGSEVQLLTPPDKNYDHANFYWRAELAPLSQVSTHSTNTLGSESLAMIENEYRGKTVRIVSGKGAGQERTIVSNEETRIAITPDWSVEPNLSSEFVICESSWNFAGLSKASPAVFEPAARPNSTIHVCGRSANVNDKECSYSLSPVTRYTINQTGDYDVPAAPTFGLFTPGRGVVEISGIAFEDLSNTQTVAAASLTLHVWNELSESPTVQLEDVLSEEAVEIQFEGEQSVEANSIIQIEDEIIRVQAVENGIATVERGAFGSMPAEHAAATPAYRLERRVFVLPFGRGFFGSPASGSYAHNVILPNVRIVAAEMFVTNKFGNSETKAISYTQTLDRGLRTLSGGQFCLQIDGAVAIQSNAVPPITVDSGHAIRDVFATVETAPTGAALKLRLTQDGNALCELSILPDESMSAAVDGNTLPPLKAGGRLGLDILSAGAAASQPPTNLTVSVRL